MSKTNILYLHSHDTGRYIQPYGHAVPTPHLQEFANDAVIFRQAFCANPTCSPSRAALLTGAYPHSPANGMFGLAHRGWRLNDYSKHLVTTLKKAGYETTLSGAQHEGKDPIKELGYDRYLGGDAPLHVGAENRAALYLENEPTQPFFLSCGFHETHRDFPEPDSDINPNFVQPPAPLPDTPETRYDMAAYQAKVRLLDHKMGIVLKALERSGLAENTLVICTTDHGVAFPKMKCSLTDHGTGVMLMMRGPRGFSGGRAVDALVSQVDIFPTLCEYLGIESPPWLQGHSLLPLIDGRASSIREEVFAEVNAHAAYEPMRSVRTKRWKYIKRLDGRRTPVLPNCDESPSKDFLLREGWAEHPHAEESLFDLLHDPHEANNLAHDARYQSVLDDLRRRLEKHQRETEDPLQDGGKLEIPEGVLSNRANDKSPSDPTVPLRSLLE